MNKNRFVELFSKKYTLIFVPDVTKFKRFSVSVIIAKSGFWLGLMLLLGFSYFSYTVIQRNADLEELDGLRVSSVEQKREILKFAQKLQHIESQLSRLEQFDRKLRVMTAQEDRQDSTKDFGSGGPHLNNKSTFPNTPNKLLKSYTDILINELGKVERKVEEQEASFSEMHKFLMARASVLSHTPSIVPVEGWITSSFGRRRSPFTGKREMHEGLDIAARTGTPIVAPADGTVIKVGYNGGYGKVVVIDHGNGIVTKFGHNSKNLTKVGKKVRRGDVIAKLGNTGRSTGPHVHYEVLLNGVAVNPSRYILSNKTN